MYLFKTVANKLIALNYSCDAMFVVPHTETVACFNMYVGRTKSYSLCVNKGGKRRI